MPTPRVVVTGDLLLDHNIRRRIPDLAQTYSNPFTESVGSQSLGGAWYLSRLIGATLNRYLIDRQLQNLRTKFTGTLTEAQQKNKREATNKMEAEVESQLNEWEKNLGLHDFEFSEATGPQRGTFSSLKEEMIAKAYSVWCEYPPEVGKKVKDGARWRVESFMGCQQSQLATDVDQRAPGKPLSRGLVSELQKIYSPTQNAARDILVIDDLNLGYGKIDQFWPKFLDVKNTRGQLPKGIFLKVAGNLTHHPLWERLKPFRDRLTVIVSADDLRARGADLKVGYSWDRTIEELNAEFRDGASKDDLALCYRTCVFFRGGSAAAVYSRGWLGVTEPPATPSLRKHAVLQRFLYRPEEPEGAFLTRHDGNMFGATSLITAALVLNQWTEIQDEKTSIPLFFALARGLEAIRANLAAGGQGHKNSAATADQLTPKYKDLCDLLVLGYTREEAQKKQAEGKTPEDAAAGYFTAYPQGDDSPLSGDAPTRMSVLAGGTLLSGSTPEVSDLLGDIAGPGLEYMHAVGVQVVRDGWKKHLKAAPRAAYGDLVTFDRDEIERINSVRALIQAYLDNKDDKRPLSVAVFGQPGTGKGFAVKELAKSFNHHTFEKLPFNLSEFSEDPSEGLKEFHAALHQVRDKTIGGTIPLVFWDEFDASNLRWLKQFLAPMQDHEFRVGSVIHNLGRAIFVFAGGTSHTYEEFRQKASLDRNAKGPDFISRLRGHMNIKGPNCDENAPGMDAAHIIRRAILLRTLLQLHYKHLINPVTDRANISNEVIRGFLRVKRFHHASRSMESILSMSHLAGRGRFERSQLPSKAQLEMHATEDFLGEIEEIAGIPDYIEAMAAGCWVSYMRQHDAKESDEVLKAQYYALSEQEKENNRRVAYVAPAKLASVGWAFRKRGKTSKDKPVLSSEDHKLAAKLRQLHEIEHDRWLREKLISGFAYAPVSNSTRRVNQNITRFEDLADDKQKLDGIAHEALTKVLAEHNIDIVVQEAQ